MASTSVLLDVNGRKVKATEITYDDLIFLYDSFIQDRGYVPTTRDCTSSNNLPQMRIINRVLKDIGVTYKDFIGAYGKKSHARASASDYDLFLSKFKEYSNELGRPLTSIELVSEKYNLPSVKWFVKFCPDKSVKNYRDFVSWCGYEPCKKIWTKDEIAEALRKFECDNSRNVVREDITTDNLGFSMIVINRLFGCLENARVECGLLPLSPRYCEPDAHYVDSLTDVILDYKQKTGNPYISWDAIESGQYGSRTYNHKSYTKHFNNAGIDLFAHIKSLGCLMNQSGYSNCYIFDSGELVRSSMEYDFTTYLNDCGFVYGQDYKRDVRYRDFSNTTGKIDCDYVIYVGDTNVYIEVAGVLDSSFDGEWDTIDLRDDRHIVYRDTLLKKRNILESIGVEYYFIFKDDMTNSSYKNLIDSLYSRRESALRVS